MNDYNIGYRLVKNKEVSSRLISMGEKIAILGAGNGGYALASDLALSGYKVNLFELGRFSDFNLKPIEEKGGIEREGMRPGLAQIDVLTSNIDEALEDVKVVNVTIPAFAHREFIELMAQHLDSKTVIFFPLNFADVKLSRFIDENDLGIKTIIAGGETMPYACRRMGRPAYIFVRWIFPRIRVAAIPARNTGKLMESTKGYPINLKPVKSTLEVSMAYENPVGHIPMMILNAASIERTSGFWEIFYDTLVGGKEREGKPQRSQEKLIEAIKKEQSAVCEKLGFSFEAEPFMGELPSPAVPWSMETYWSMTERLDYRYLTEDVPFGLVTWASFGDLLGIETPTLDACIQIASVLLNRDFFAEGMTIEKLGFARMNVKQVVDFFK
jgi:opine dehydrogenase